MDLIRSIFVLCNPGYTLIFYCRPGSVVPIFDTDLDPRAKRKRVKRSVTLLPKEGVIVAMLHNGLVCRGCCAVAGRPER